MICKGKEIPVQDWTGPEGSRNWGSPILRHLGGEGLTPRVPLPPPPQEITLVLVSFRG